MKTENRNHRRFLPDYVATGSVRNEDSTIEVSLFRDQFRRLRPGDTLPVYRLSSGEWLNAERLEESKPILRLFGLHFSWHFPAGILMLIASLLWIRKRKRVRE